MKAIKCRILTIAEEHINLLDKCVRRQTKISLTASEYDLAKYVS
jgi:hypothetical protein